MCNEDNCNDGKEKATNENIVESEMTFEAASMKMAMGRMNKIYPGSVKPGGGEPGGVEPGGGEPGVGEPGVSPTGSPGVSPSVSPGVSPGSSGIKNYK